MATSLESKATDLAADIGKLGATALRIKEERDALAEALRSAKETIKVWHNMGGNEGVWDIYDRSAPEMKIINAALAQVQS